MRVAKHLPRARTAPQDPTAKAGAHQAEPMAEVTPRKFAGHSMLCPYDGNFECKGKAPA